MNSWSSRSSLSLEPPVNSLVSVWRNPDVGAHLTIGAGEQWIGDMWS